MRADELYRALRESLAPVAGEGAAYEARELLSVLTGEPFPMLLASRTELSAETVAAAENAVVRRKGGEPLAYILGFA